MKFLVGSKKNPIKLRAVVDLRSEFLCLHDAEIDAGDAESGVSDQPKTFDEIALGSINRASSVRPAADRIPGVYGIGIESGLVQALSAWFDITIATIIGDGKMWQGMSWGFIVPPDVMIHIHQGLDLSQAAKAAGYTTKEKVGNEEGIIGVLTGGRVPRVEQAKSALRLALHDFERQFRT